MEFKKLITKNKFKQLQNALQSVNNQLTVYDILLKTLQHEMIDGEKLSFNQDYYDKEWLEGIELYKLLDQSKLPSDLLEKYRMGLFHLIFKLSAHVRNLAFLEHEEGFVVNPDFQVNPELRAVQQQFIDLLASRKLLKDVANMASVKAQLSNSVTQGIEKHEIGQDMIQYADSFEKIGYEEQAVHVYQAILKDFECESVRLSSGLFPEITYVDNRPIEEIEIFNQAQTAYERLTGTTLPNINRAHVGGGSTS